MSLLSCRPFLCLAVPRVHAAPEIHAIPAFREVAIGPLAFIGETIEECSQSNSRSIGLDRYVIGSFSAQLCVNTCLRT
jgi:hypothetical protein